MKEIQIQVTLQKSLIQTAHLANTSTIVKNNLTKRNRRKWKSNLLHLRCSKK